MVIVIDNFELGGVQRVLVTLATALKAAGYDVVVAAFDEKGPLKKELNRVEVVTIPLRRSALTWWLHYIRDEDLRRWLWEKRIRKVLRYAAGLKHVLGRSPQNIVLSGDMFGNCAVAEVQKILGRQSVRSVVSIHSYVLQRKEPDGETSNAGGESENGSVRSVPSGPWPRDYVSRCLQQVDEVIAVSDGLVDDVVDLMGAGFSVSRIYDPVITERLRCLSAGPPEHPWAKRKEAPLVVSVGRFGPQKDFLFLIEAFALVRARRDVRLMLIGYNAKSKAHRVYKAKLEEKAKRLGIADSITMLPAMENPYALMRAADVYVSSSPAEGFGNVLVEALYCGVPIVSTDCPGGPREILDDGEYGALTPAGDAKAMADAICNALDYPPERSVLSERAEVFSLDRALAKYQEVLERLPPFDG